MAAKRWVEQRLCWLADEFGRDVFIRRAMILPTEEFFPEPFDGSDASIRAMLDQVCRYMDAEPEDVELELFEDRQDYLLVNEHGQAIGQAAGLYEKDGRTRIHIEASQAADPVVLVGTMAHEIAHHRLLGERRIRATAYDHELLTDLTVVFHGLGIFLANCPRAWESDFTRWPGTDLLKPEYMTLPMFGYALAHAAWLRGETKPAWAKRLRRDARASLKQGIDYLQRTDDSTFGPGR